MVVHYKCETCGKTGKRVYPNDKVPGHFFCSRTCQNVWQKSRTDLVEKNKDPAFRKKVSEGLKKRKQTLGDNYHSKETKQKIGAATVRHWESYDDETRQKMLDTLSRNAQERRLYGPYGINVPDILDELNFLDAPSARGKKWTKTSLVYLLQNEKYIGDQQLQKWVSVDHISHRSVPNDSTAIPSYYVKNTHTPIIDRHTFRQVQRIMELKSPHGEYSRYPYCDTDFICPICGKKMTPQVMHTQVKKRAICCFGEDGCQGYSIKTYLVDAALLEAYNTLELKGCKKSAAWKRMQEIRAESPKMESVQYYWLDDLVERVEFRGDEMCVFWKCGLESEVPLNIPKSEEPTHVAALYYEELICRNPDWELVKIYSDKHSATSVKNRPGFQEMMADAKARKIDVLLVKSISRFARNVVDCQQYLQKLESYGVCVQFEKENIRTDDPTSGFVLSLLSAVAQDESHSISKNVQLSYESRFKRGEYNLGNNRILGYDCIDGELVPNQDAWIVKEVFRRFLAGESYRQISKGLKEMGAKCLHSERGFGVETLRYMISNETYVGDKCLHKKAPLDYLIKKPDPNRKHGPNYLWDDHEAIIDRETWDRAQAILNERKELEKAGVHKANREHHFLYGKVFCGECGAPFLRRTFNGSAPYKAWNCRNRQKGKDESKCSNRFIREEQLLNEIQRELGWSAMDRERFEKEVSRVLVFADRIEVIKE